MKKLPGRAVLCIVVVLLLAGMGLRAEDTCPALNRTRAAAALAGSGQPQELQLAMEWRSAEDYTCSYAEGQNTLRIAVSPYHARDGWPSYASRCLAPAGAVAGIGDEAVRCNTPDGAKPIQQEVLAHVRDTFFDVRMTFGSAAAAPQDALRHVAEQIAANLF